MAKRKIPSASKKRLPVFGTVSIIAIVYFIFSLLFNIYTIFDLTREKSNLQNSLVALQEKAEELKIDIEKFNDPDYLADYAREHFRYSKEGEYIIQMEGIEETDELINTLTININRNYCIVGLSVLMLVVFIYILSKGKQSKKKRRK